MTVLLSWLAFAAVILVCVSPALWLAWRLDRRDRERRDALRRNQAWRPRR